MDYTNTDNREKLLNSVLEDMSEKCSPASFNWLFKNLKITYMTKTEVDVLAPDAVAYDSINKRYLSDLTEAFIKYLGYTVKVNVRNKSDQPREKEPMQDDDSEYTAYKLRYNPAYTFDSFVVGSSNQLAARASLAVAETPAQLYNPLFIYGPPGIGKTHLLFAIVNHVRQTNPHFHILYKTGEEFTQEMVDSLINHTTHEFREKYRTLDVFLVDDIQFIENKDTTQEEFFHTINTLFQHGKQVIITSDRPPKDINLEERLKSRFQMGLIADIQPPDEELRQAIFKKKSGEMGIEIPDNVLEFLSKNITSNIRQIEGALRKLKAHSFIENKKITLDMAKTELSEYLNAVRTQDDITQKIFDYICKKYTVKKEILLSGKRNSEIVYARNICIYAFRSLTDLSLKRIGQMFGKDHTTIINSISNVEAKMQTDTVYEREVRTVIRELENQ